MRALESWKRRLWFSISVVPVVSRLGPLSLFRLTGSIRNLHGGATECQGDEIHCVLPIDNFQSNSIVLMNHGLAFIEVSTPRGTTLTPSECEPTYSVF